MLIDDTGTSLSCFVLVNKSGTMTKEQILHLAQEHPEIFLPRIIRTLQQTRNHLHYYETYKHIVTDMYNTLSRQYASYVSKQPELYDKFQTIDDKINFLHSSFLFENITWKLDH